MRTVSNKIGVFCCKFRESASSALPINTEGAIDAWGAVDDEWSLVPYSFAENTFIALRTVLFSIDSIVRGHAGDADLSAMNYRNIYGIQIASCLRLFMRTMSFYM